MIFQDKINSYLKQFQNLDVQKIGVLSFEQCKTLLRNNQVQCQNEELFKNHAMTQGDYLTFDEFLSLLGQIESSEEKESKPNRYVLQFLGLIEIYRANCIQQCNYIEAKKAQERINEIKRKQIQRKKAKTNIQYQKEIKSFSYAEKNNVKQFIENWKHSINMFQHYALNNIKKLREKQELQLKKQIEKLSQKKQFLKNKFSKRLHQLRFKEKTLAKLRLYDSAYQIKLKADRLQTKEIRKNQNKLIESMEKRLKNIKHQQYLNLMAHIHRIQTERKSHIKKREIESSHIINKINNIKKQIKTKKMQGMKKTLQILNEQFAYLTHRKPISNLKVITVINHSDRQ